jgi:hypothetical protein
MPLIANFVLLSFYAMHDAAAAAVDGVVEYYSTVL